MNKTAYFIPAKKSLSFAFSGCGWLSPFHLGVIKKMILTGYLSDQSLVAGTSGGALAALLACSSISTDNALELVISMSKDKSFKSNIDMGMKKSLREMLPNDTLDRVQGRLHICVTRVWPNPTIQPVILSSFDSIDSLLDGVAASCFIPFYSNRRNIFTNISEQKDLYMDGGVHAHIPPIGDVRVAPFPRNFAFRSRSKPHICLENPKYPIPRLLTYVLRPAPESVLIDLYDEGFKAADNWIDEYEKRQFSQQL